MTSEPARAVGTGDLAVSPLCCPPFDPATFQDKEITWAGKTFVKERVHSIFHVPLDMGRKLTKAMRLIESAHATTAQRLILSDELSPWRSDLYIDANGPVEGAETAVLSGTFLTRVYEGPFRDAPKWCADMAARVVAKGRTLKKTYLGFTTCPACAKAYGKNYVVVLAQVAPRSSTQAE